MTRFRPGVALSLLALVLVPTGAALGMWQLHRADQKRALEDGYLASLGGLPADEETLRARGNDVALMRTRLIGECAGAGQFFVDNRTHDGLPGYWVVTPFRSSNSGATYLVNRGWIAARGRDELPVAMPPGGPQRIEVVPWPSTGLGLLAGADDWSDGWPKRVQRMDIARMSMLVPVALSYELRLEAGSPGVLEPVAATLDLSPARHLGYAVQWFALSIVLAATWLVLGLRRGRTGASP